MTNILKIHYPEWNTTKQEYEYKFVNLLPYADISGMALTSWTASQQIYNGRNVFPPRFQEVSENIQINLVGYDQDDVFLELKLFYEAATAIAEYWLELNPTIPAPYLEAKADKEDNSRYAVITERPNLTQLGKPIEQPFYNLNDVVLENITLNVTRLEWRSNTPGEGECTNLDNEFRWANTDLISLVDSLSQNRFDLFIESQNGYIIEANFDSIKRSINDGVTWTVEYNLGSAAHYRITEFLVTSPPTLIANDFGADLIQSTDSGNSWSTLAFPGAAPRSVFYSKHTKRLYVGISGTLYYTTDLSSWSTIALPITVPVYDILEVDSNTILLGVDYGVLISTDSGSNWELYSPPFAGADGFVYCWRLVLLSTGRILACVPGGLSISDDNGATWIYYRANVLIGTAIATTSVITDVAYSDGLYFCTVGDFSNVIHVSPASYYSLDLINWVEITDITWTTTAVPASGNDLYGATCVVTTPDGSIIFGSSEDTDSETWRWAIEDQLTLGFSNCGSVYVSNKNVISNLTNLKHFDSSTTTYTDISMTTVPATLLPASPALNDILYFFTDTSLNDSGVFSNIAINLSFPLLGVTFASAFTTVWEYWNGAWTTLTVTDTTAGNYALQIVGKQLVSFEPPSDWVTTTIDGVTGYIVRMRISAATTPPNLSPPIQDDWPIFAVQKAYLDINSIDGDLDAITKLTVMNMSDEDGRGGSSPDLYSGRVIIGRRKLSRGDNFVAYLNASDEQNQLGIIITAGTNVTVQADVQAPTGRSYRYNPTGVEAMADRLTWDLGGVLGLQYTGDYHVYARVHRTAGASTDFDVQLKVVYGSGGLNFTTDSVQVQTTTQFELLDFGTITVPRFDSLTDTLQFIIQASAASGTPNLDLFDLILIPVDEWAGDFIDSANVSGSEMSKNESLEVNGLKPLEVPIVARDLSSAIKSQYETSGPSLYIEPLPDDTQRLWFLQAQASATGDSFSWIAKPEICSLVTIDHNPGYMGFQA